MASLPSMTSRKSRWNSRQLSRGQPYVSHLKILNATILPITPGPERYKVAYDLYTEIVYRTTSIPGDDRHWISAVEARRFRVSRVRSMEEDQGLQLVTQVERESWPSLMIEVECSETQELLHLDAEWWLFNSESRTRLVIIATISRDPFRLRIKCWKMGLDE